MIVNSNISIEKLVKDDIGKADVLNDFKIDICCRANRSLESVCQEKNIDSRLVIEEMNQIKDYAKISIKQDMNWPLDLLIEYILIYHHFYLVLLRHQ